MVGLGDADGGELLDGDSGAVDLDADGIDQARVGPAGADAGQGATEHGDGLLHAFFNVQEDLVARHGLVSGGLGGEEGERTTEKNAK